MEIESRYFRSLGGALKYGFVPGKLALSVKVDNNFKTLLFVPQGDEPETGETSEPSESDEPSEEGGRSVIEELKRRGVEFYGTGNEPGWTLEIGPEELVFKTNYGEDTYRFPTPEPEANPERLRTTYRAESDGRELLVEVLGVACADDMSGERFESMVRIMFDGQTLTGCGLALR
jgi:uncharacterized membrane protein